MGNPLKFKNNTTHNFENGLKNDYYKPSGHPIINITTNELIQQIVPSAKGYSNLINEY